MRRKTKDNESRNGALDMETIATLAVMAILAACMAAGMVGNDEEAMEA